MPSRKPIDAYRARTINTFRSEFALHTDVASTLEKAVLVVRQHPTIVHVVSDMLMVQCLKTHAAVSLIAQHGLMEDASTLTRRLLELSLQAVYIGMEGEEPVQRRRAGAYIAHMWRGLPRDVKRRLPPTVRSYWIGIAKGYGKYVKPKARRWGPDFRTMSRAIGVEDLYVKDYSFLSSIAHGASDHQVFQYSTNTVRIHSDDFVPILLVYSSKYYLAAAEAWNRVHGSLDQNEFARMINRVTSWRPRGGAA